MNTLASRVKQQRLDQGLNQSKVAKALGVSRPTYIAIESGEKELTLSQLQRLASFLRVSAQELQNEVDTSSTGDFRMPKYKQIILNCIKYGADESDGKIPKTKLAKLAYLSDFAWFYDHLEPMTGLAYRRIQQGPVPDEFFRAIDELFEEGAISIHQSGAAFMIQANETSADSKLLNSDELAKVKEVANKWRGKPTGEIVEFTHSQLPWKICRQGEYIPYELITQEDSAHVF